MKKTLFIHYFLPVLLFLTACQKKDAGPSTDKTNFESLMGKGLPAWQYVQTKEDVENLSYFRKIFEQNIHLLPVHKQELKIPKVIHFIWIGPKNFPRESVENVKSWMARHPDWTVKFWTDRPRPLPHPHMQVAFVQDLKFLKLSECYRKSDNYAEKSDLLRYEILYQEGGVYVDHDVKCFKPFDTLNSSYDLYCGLELPSASPLSSSVNVTNNLIGARPGHPVIKNCLEWLPSKWEEIEKLYPGKDKDAVIQRVSHRTFAAFTDSVRQLAGKQGNVDMVFPAFYFNAPKDAFALMARHLYEGTWFENETPFEKMARERLMIITKKTNKILLFTALVSGINLIGFIILFLKFRKRAAS
jgi:hypothetical protein